MGLLSRFLSSHANRTRFVLACWFVILMLYALWASYLNRGSDDSVSYVLCIAMTILAFIAGFLAGIAGVVLAALAWIWWSVRRMD